MLHVLIFRIRSSHVWNNHRQCLTCCRHMTIFNQDYIYHSYKTVFCVCLERKAHRHVQHEFGQWCDMNSTCDTMWLCFINYVLLHYGIRSTGPISVAVGASSRRLGSLNMSCTAGLIVLNLFCRSSSCLIVLNLFYFVGPVVVLLF